MTGAAALIFLAVVAGYLGPRQLRAASWVNVLPAWGIFAWLTLSISIFSSLLLAGLTLAVPAIPAHEGLADLVHVCAEAFRSKLSTPSGVLSFGTGSTLVVVLLVRLVVSATRRFYSANVARAEHRMRLAFVSHAHPASDVSVLAHPTPVAYCLPGRRGRIVISQGALTVLSAPQLESVLTHERAHLRARHHLISLVIDSLSAALGGHLGTAQARSAVADLLELHADDAAATWQRRHLAAALVLLAHPVHPTGALAAGARSTLIRVRRLTATSDGTLIRKRLRVVPIVATVIAATIPILMIATPTLMAILVGDCSLVL